MKGQVFDMIYVRPAIGGWIVGTAREEFTGLSRTEYVVTDGAELLALVVQLAPKLTVNPELPKC
jgi:hypothetical protein